jgi:hypothetical protein
MPSAMRDDKRVKNGVGREPKSKSNFERARGHPNFRFRERFGVCVPASAGTNGVIYCHRKM